MGSRFFLLRTSLAKPAERNAGAEESASRGCAWNRRPPLATRQPSTGASLGLSIDCFDYSVSAKTSPSEARQERVASPRFLPAHAASLARNSARMSILRQQSLSSRWQPHGFR